jgi:outer membrane receptor protein involved in Fe transport
VNLRTHAHGQGYADLHFLIPETVERIEALKGPYHVELGDFATAGAVNFVLRDTVGENTAQAAGGMFGTQRYLIMGSPTPDALRTLVAVEGYVTDGPFVHGQNYQRFNAFAKAAAGLAEGLDAALWVSHLRSGWHGSGQIPERAVRAGLIGRFGAIDDSEGGRTTRTSVNAMLRWRPSERDTVSVQSYAHYYTLDLFSNFTFFLDDPVNGDGIRQTDRRWVAGTDARWERRLTVAGVPLTTTTGVQYRVDTPRVVLANQADRHALARTQDVTVVEQSVSPFLKVEIVPRSWLRVVTGARGDVFHDDVADNLHGEGGRLTGNATRALPSWKANVVLGPWLDTEVFGNYGIGFHSNDARAVILDQTLTALPRATGWEVGVKDARGAARGAVTGLLVARSRIRAGLRGRRRHHGAARPEPPPRLGAGGQSPAAGLACLHRRRDGAARASPTATRSPWRRGRPRAPT